MPAFDSLKKWVNDVFFSFPLQLLLLHLRSNHLLLGLWIFLSLLVTGTFGNTFGIRYLFLDPEYLGRVNFWSFLIVGVTFGGFFMGWNLTTYLLCTHHFPFLAALKRPFTKFCINNGLVPAFFLGIYLASLIRFRVQVEFWNNEQFLHNLAGFAIGLVVTILMYSLFFQFANKDISHFQKRGDSKLVEPEPMLEPGHRGVDVGLIKQDINRWRVDTYLGETLRPRLVRSVAHYENSFLLRIFRQNHYNALLVQIATLVILICFGFLLDYQFFRIPAGASVFILTSIIVALIGSVTYWFYRWRVTIFLLLALVINSLTALPSLRKKNHAFGLDYSTERVEYSHDALRQMRDPKVMQADADSIRQILEIWRSKFKGRKPPLVIMGISGGGLKASAWTMQVLQKSDAHLRGKLMKHTVLISGASGGIIGAAYFRELMLRRQRGDALNPYNEDFLHKISLDLLNSIAVSVVSNDIFLPWSSFSYAGQTYTKDRGYMFELQLNENTGYLLDKPLSSYRLAEGRAQIPMLLITPSIVNDSRQLIISPQPFSFLMVPPERTHTFHQPEPDMVEFGKLFCEQGADNLRFTSALRMSATYPFILPDVSLPSEPAIEVIDAGIRDNLGIISGSRFVQVFQDWIRQHTSGVVFVLISSVREVRPIGTTEHQGIVESLFNPLGPLGHITRVQDYENESNLSFAANILGNIPLEVLHFTYEPSPENERASMSFHLTRREKQDILNAFYLESNQRSLHRLEEILK